MINPQEIQWKSFLHVYAVGCKMIGQEKLIEKVEKVNRDTIPHSLILLGEIGSGRHTIFGMIRDKLCLPCFDITDKLSQELIDDIYLKGEPILYLIDVDAITVRESNMILKLVEEPLKNAFFVFIGKTRNGILPTVLNRCQIWEMEKYTDEHLRLFLNTLCDNGSDYFELIEYCNTPGQLLSAMNIGMESIKDIKSMCNLMIDHIGKANFSNTLTISNRIAFKKEPDKWDYDLFMRVFQKEVKCRLVNNWTTSMYTLFMMVSSVLKDGDNVYINRKLLFEHFLCACKYVLG